MKTVKNQKGNALAGIVIGFGVIVTYMSALGLKGLLYFPEAMRPVLYVGLLVGLIFVYRGVKRLDSK